MAALGSIFCALASSPPDHPACTKNAEEPDFGLWLVAQGGRLPPDFEIDL
jgi:hypothetical protein